MTFTKCQASHFSLLYNAHTKILCNFTTRARACALQGRSIFLGKRTHKSTENSAFSGGRWYGAKSVKYNAEWKLNFTKNAWKAQKIRTEGWKIDSREAEKMIVLGCGKYLPRHPVCCAKAYIIIYLARERGRWIFSSLRRVTPMLLCKI